MSSSNGSSGSSGSAGAAAPGCVVSPEWLAARLGRVKVLDASWCVLRRV